MPKNDFKWIEDLYKQLKDFAWKPRNAPGAKGSTGRADDEDHAYRLQRTKLLVGTNKVLYCAKCSTDISPIIAARKSYEYDHKADTLIVTINCPYCKAPEYTITFK